MPVELSTLRYFKPPDDYFWQWEENLTIIGWRKGFTIGYSQDIINLLKSHREGGLPSFGALLLVLTAAKDDWQINNQLVSRTLLSIWSKANQTDRDALRQMVNDVLDLLDRISAIRKDVRTGEKRDLLLHTIFENDDDKYFAKAEEVLIEFESGGIDTLISSNLVQPDLKECFKKDLITLSRAAKEFPTTESLELKLRTGIKQLPAPIELAPVPPTGHDLLQQLSQDAATAGLANLTRHIVAALHIPLHTHGSSDQSFGGVSDITNRGNFDRLLLSELAHDDLSLMARLANNEALYLRREELPSKHEKRQVLLLDTTLKLWGMPRVFAVSAALASIRNNKSKAAVESFALHGKDFHRIDLASKEGVVKALSQLDAALYCGHAFTAFMSKWQQQDGDEFFLVTDEENLHSSYFQRILAALPIALNYVITVNRNGHLQFYEYLNHHRKLISEARFDLEAILFGTNQSQLDKDVELPEGEFPLYYPASKIIFRPEKIFVINRTRTVAITLDERVLYWSDRKLGARELMPSIPPGRYSVGCRNDMIYIVAYDLFEQPSKLYRIPLTSGTRETIELPPVDAGHTIIGFDEVFYISFGGRYHKLDPETGTLTKIEGDHSKARATVSKAWYEKADFHFIKKFVNCGYGVINNVRRIYVTKNDRLAIDDHTLVLNTTGLQLTPLTKKDEKRFPRTSFSDRKIERYSRYNTLVKCSEFSFADGSVIIADSRGFLRLTSSNSSIPGIIVLMVLNSPVACWASDGFACGDSYFTGFRRPNVINAMEFYQKYIQPFIDTLT